MPQRDQLGRDRSKLSADALGCRVIARSGAGRLTSHRHDAAEAILIGLWGVLAAGWLDALPAEFGPSRSPGGS